MDKKGVEEKEESVPVAPSTSFEMLKPPNNGSSVVHNPDVNQDADQDADQDVDPDVNGNNPVKIPIVVDFQRIKL